MALWSTAVGNAVNGRGHSIGASIRPVSAILRLSGDIDCRCPKIPEALKQRQSHFYSCTRPARRLPISTAVVRDDRTVVLRHFVHGGLGMVSSWPSRNAGGFSSFMRGLTFVVIFTSVRYCGVIVRVAAQERTCSSIEIP